MAKWPGSRRPQQPGVLVSPRVYRLRSDSFQLYSHSDLPIRASLPKVYQRERRIPGYLSSCGPFILTVVDKQQCSFESIGEPKVNVFIMAQNAHVYK